MIVTLIALAVVYAGDSLWVHQRMAHKTSTNPLEVINLQPIYAIPRKDGRDEFDFGASQSETCVHSLFPHLGYVPCWYARRSNQKPIPLAALGSNAQP
jgi:hypothetical protein